MNEPRLGLWKSGQAGFKNPFDWYEKAGMLLPGRWNTSFPVFFSGPRTACTMHWATVPLWCCRLWWPSSNRTSRKAFLPWRTLYKPAKSKMGSLETWETTSHLPALGWSWPWLQRRASAIQLHDLLWFSVNSWIRVGLLFGFHATSPSFWKLGGWAMESQGEECRGVSRHFTRVGMGGNRHAGQSRPRRAHSLWDALGEPLIHMGMLLFGFKRICLKASGCSKWYGLLLLFESLFYVGRKVPEEAISNTGEFWLDWSSKLI